MVDVKCAISAPNNHSAVVLQYRLQCSVLRVAATDMGKWVKPESRLDSNSSAARSSIGQQEAEAEPIYVKRGKGKLTRRILSVLPS